MVSILSSKAFLYLRLASRRFDPPRSICDAAVDFSGRNRQPRHFAYRFRRSWRGSGRAFLQGYFAENVQTTHVPVHWSSRRWRLLRRLANKLLLLQIPDALPDHFLGLARLLGYDCHYSLSVFLLPDVTPCELSVPFLVFIPA